MKIHRDITQGSIEWHEIRRGCFGGSSASVFFVGDENTIGAGLMSKIYENLAKRLFNDYEESFTSFEMQRGTDLEPLAREEYENLNFCEVEEVGYISINEWLGVSPDGLVGPEGMIEIKCPMGKEWIRFKRERTIPQKYIAQMQWGMWIAGREWCDFICYHPDGGLVSERVERDENAMSLLNTKTELVLAELNELKKLIS